jgi:formylglycine-generating enzyme required for sulfatase activity
MRASAGLVAAGAVLFAAFSPPGVPLTPPGSTAASTVEPRTGMPLVEIPAGRFTMGSAAAETGRNPDETRHVVVITTAFLLGAHEVTQQECARS